MSRPWRELSTELADLLGETLETDSQNVWKNKRTPTSVRRFGVRLHPSTISNGRSTTAATSHPAGALVKLQEDAEPRRPDDTDTQSVLACHRTAFVASRMTSMASFSVSMPTA